MPVRWRTIRQTQSMAMPVSLCVPFCQFEHGDTCGTDDCEQGHRGEPCRICQPFNNPCGNHERNEQCSHHHDACRYGWAVIDWGQLVALVSVEFCDPVRCGPCVETLIAQCTLHGCAHRFTAFKSNNMATASSTGLLVSARVAHTSASWVWSRFSASNTM